MNDISRLTNMFNWIGLIVLMLMLVLLNGCTALHLGSNSQSTASNRNVSQSRETQSLRGRLCVLLRSAIEDDQKHVLNLQPLS